MKPQDKKYLPEKSLQNLAAIFTMLLGVALSFTPLGWVVWLFPFVSIVIVMIGAVMSLWLIYRRDPSQRKPGFVGALAAACWLALLIAVLLYLFAPGVYGYDLEILVNAFTVVAWSTLLGLLFTIIALLRR
jgi:RsiW-degrading membrane proteinase PrsW (M82 family)